ncbi:sigma-70 family RNA polymerase sigma factor [Armatimonas sp.]|uniref:sigma-70 family RNA polymerase sigma factor n=1 Tax=Armatimonas sp. TaxID=1872638 RepID=UPI003752A077
MPANDANWDEGILLRRAHQGDATAFDQLWQQQLPALTRFCRSLHRPSGSDATFDADDLVAETFIRALHHLNRYRPALGGLDAWLREIARNLFLNRCTREQRRTRLLAVPLRSTHTALAHTDPTWSHALLQSAIQEINALPSPLRAVFQLHLDEFSHQEIAQRLQLSTGNASKRLERARLRLRQRLTLLLDELPLLEDQLSAIVRNFHVVEVRLETGGIVQICLSAPASPRTLPSRRGGNSWLQRAHALYQRGDWEAAESEYRTLLKKHPPTIGAIRALVPILREQQRLPELLTALPTEILPGTPPALQTEIRGYAALARGDTDTARAALYEAIALAPEDPELHVALDQLLADQSRYEEQLANLAVLRRLLPHDSRGYVAVAHPYARLQRDAEALPLLEQAVVLNPNSPEAIKELFQVRMRMKLHDHTTESLARRLVYLAPELLDSWHSLAWFWREQGRPAPGAALLTRFVQDHPHHALAHAALAWAQLYANSPLACAHHARCAYQLAPRRPYVAWTMAMACGCTPSVISVQEAQAHLTEIARNFPRDSFLQLEVAERFVSRGLPLKALRSARRAFRLNPKTNEAALLQSIYQELGHDGRRLRVPATSRPSD